MYLTEEDLILLIVKALIKKKKAAGDCGCSIQADMEEIRKADKTILPMSPMKSKKMPDVSGMVADAPVFTSKTVVSSTLPASPRNLGVKSVALPPSPRNMVSGNLTASGMASAMTLPPSPRSGMVSASVTTSGLALPPSPRRSVASTMTPSPRSEMVSTMNLPPSPRSGMALPPSPRKSELSSLSYKSTTLPSIQKSPVATRTSLPKLSNLTQL